MFPFWLHALGLAALSAVCAAGSSSSNNTLSFLAIGDWGKLANNNNNNNNGNNKNGNKVSGTGIEDPLLDRWLKQNEVVYQKDIAKAMSGYVNSTGIKMDFVLSLGDNFYNNGVNILFS
jgi:hypothetical protein